MTTVLLLIHLLVSAGLVTVVLLQRSEGGALGIGGGPSGMMSDRSAATLLTRLTMVLGAAFFGMSILLAFVAAAGSDRETAFDRAAEQDEPLIPGLEDEDGPVPTDG